MFSGYFFYFILSDGKEVINEKNEIKENAFSSHAFSISCAPLVSPIGTQLYYLPGTLYSFVASSITRTQSFPTFVVGEVNSMVSLFSNVPAG